LGAVVRFGLRAGGGGVGSPVAFGGAVFGSSALAAGALEGADFVVAAFGSETGGCCARAQFTTGTPTPPAAMKAVRLIAAR
jgi:hypothetical protein